MSPGFLEAVGGAQRLDYAVAHLNAARFDGASDHDPCVLTFPIPGSEQGR